MATAKKSKKKSVKKSKIARNAHERLEQATTPEELLAGLPAVNEEHDKQVRILGRRLIAVIEKTNFHPIVALDALQILLSAGVGAALGEQHQRLFDAHIHRYHDESKLLSIMDLFGGLEELRQATEAEDANAPDSPATPEASKE